MYGIISRRSAANVLGVMAIAVAVAGCDSDAASSSVPRGSVAEVTPQDWYRGERPILRSQADAVGGRLWVLTPDGVELYDAQTRRRVAQIALPDWVWAGEAFACAPDLAIGPRGEAVISSNVVPTLWQVNPVTLKVSRHELLLDNDTGKDVGFTGLAYSTRHQAFFAVSALHGSMWRIDPSLQRAQDIPLSEPLPKACGIAMRTRTADQRANRFAAFCVRADQGDWSVNLAPDQRSGYAKPGQCMS
jgi:hypothetical protein